MAVKRTREACHESQDVFAQRLGTTSTSVSRIERGLQTPAGFDLLNRLESTARDLGLTKEAGLFDEARSGAIRFRAYQPSVEASEPVPLPQWRLATAVRLAAVYFPERLPEIAQALAGELAVVDAILRSAVQLDYRRLEREIFSLAEQHTLEQLKRGGRDEK